jgi:Protein of unknown function (DUF1203)
MTMTVVTYDPAFVARVRAGGPDDYGNPPERALSDGQGKPCRCCLRNVPAGAAMLVVAARPFAALQPYAETGPIFLCADNCAPWGGAGLPPILETSPTYLAKGYAADHRIVYGTGQIVAPAELLAHAESTFADPRVAYVDVRSARNNCFLARIRHDPD